MNPADTHVSPANERAIAPNSWRTPALLFGLASFVETLGFGHLGAFTPLYLQQFGIPPEAIPQWTGILAAATWVIGLPLAPLWGVWADRYSRKLIIVRSTLGEGVIFFLFAVAGAPWQLLVARMLVGFILGNTGVMYAMLADLTPPRQLALAIGFISAGSTLGISVGPFVGGLLATHLGISQLYLLDAVVAWLVGLLLIVALREHRAAPRATSSSLELLRALPGNLRASPVILPLFVLYFVAFLGQNMQAPFVPLLVAEVYDGTELPVAIGTVMLVSGAVGAICTPLVGRLGGWLGPRPVLVGGLAAAALATAAQVFISDYRTLLLARSALGLVSGGLGPLIVSLIAQAAPAERRASILNVTLFPTYFAFLLGAIAGSAIATLGIRAVFAAASAVLATASGASWVLGKGGQPEPDVTPNDGAAGGTMIDSGREPGAGR
jgi:DHA1 family multidrug resistance protein-like MFS transporter